MFSNWLTSSQVRLFVQHDPNSNFYRAKNTVYFVATDALAILRDWPDFAIVNDVLYSRGAQCATPPHLSPAYYFGCREYHKVGDSSARNLTHALVVNDSSFKENV
jgi:hypothetical protein